MTNNNPAWLTRALGGQPAAAALSIARLSDEARLGRGGFALTSPAFADGGELDPSFTAHEEDAVAPPLEWTAPPADAADLVLIVEDADAPGTPCHWLAWGFPAQRVKLLEGEAPPRAGKNALGNSEWLLPRLNKDDGTHRYVFQLFASDLPLTMMPGATREDIVKALDGHVVAAAILTGSFAMPEEDEEWDDGDI